MSRQRILVVEDEPAIADTIVYALSTDGFEPQWCATGGAAIEAVRAGTFALAVLDVGLPDINGFELFKQLQQIGHGLPAIFLTARSSEIDKVVGLELGAEITSPSRFLRVSWLRAYGPYCGACNAPHRMRLCQQRLGVSPSTMSAR